MAREDIEKIKLVFTFKDGQKAKAQIAGDSDAAWGNTTEVLGRTVEARELIRGALHEAGLIRDEACGDTEDCLEAGYHLVGLDHDRDACPTEVDDDEPDDDDDEALISNLSPGYIREPLVNRRQLGEHSEWL